MKKILLTIVFFIIIIQFGNSQDRKFGIITGINYSTLFGDIRDNDVFNVGRRLSFQAGVKSRFVFSDKFVFSPRLIYSSQGYKSDADFSRLVSIDPENTPLDSEAKVQLNYLNLPIIFEYAFSDRFSLSFGPQVGFLLNEKTKVITTNIGGIEQEDRTSRNGDFKLDFGGTFGISYNISSQASIDFLYFLGVSNISREVSFIDISNNNSVFNLSLGYLLF